MAVKEFHLTLVDWYNDDEIYNLLGYLMYNYKSATITFALIWQHWQESLSKSQFKDKLKRIICERIAADFSGSSEVTDLKEQILSLCESITNISEDWYNNQKFFITRFLPLLDIIPERRKEGNSTRTIFKRIKTDYFKCNDEDKEHIRSQTRQIESGNKDEDTQAALVEENRHGLNSLGNIVLLSSHINRSYGNDKVVQKMDRIVSESTINDIYIRPHTLRVFMSKLKTLDANGISDSEVFWTDEDIKNTVETIKERLSQYLNFSDIENATQIETKEA